MAKITCICVTKNRVSALKRSIECFRAQTYADKEILIVYDRSDISTALLVESLDAADIVRYQYNNEDNQLTLGDIRNISIRQASGEYFCIWDDDDWYHKNRLSLQMKCLKESGKKASALLYLLLYDQVNNRAYLSLPRPWEATVLCSKDYALRHQVFYSSHQIEEDKSFIRRLVELDALCPVIHPQLYVYNYTGRNTWGEAHFEELFMHANVLSGRSIRTLSEALAEGSVSAGSDMLDAETFASDLTYEKIFKVFL